MTDNRYSPAQLPAHLRTHQPTKNTTLNSPEAAIHAAKQVILAMLSGTYEPPRGRTSNAEQTLQRIKEQANAGRRTLYPMQQDQAKRLAYQTARAALAVDLLTAQLSTGRADPETLEALATILISAGQSIGSSKTGSPTGIAATLRGLEAKWDAEGRADLPESRGRRFRHAVTASGLYEFSTDPLVSLAESL